MGGSFAGVSFDAYYSKVKSAITATSLTSAQVAQLPALGYSASDSLAATISDNTSYALMALYKFDPLKFFGGYEHIKYANPKTPLGAGFNDIGGYVLAFVNNTAYQNSKVRACLLDRRSLYRHSQPRPDRRLLRRSSGFLRHRNAGGLLDIRAHRLQRKPRQPFPLTPTTDSMRTSTLTSARCTAGFMTVWPAATLTRPTSTRPSACATNFDCATNANEECAMLRWRWE